LEFGGSTVSREIGKLEKVRRSGVEEGRGWWERLEEKLFKGSGLCVKEGAGLGVTMEKKLCEKLDAANTGQEVK
jgi:hypothetical protein